MNSPQTSRDCLVSNGAQFDVLKNRIIYQTIPDIDSSVKDGIVCYVNITSEEGLEAIEYLSLDCTSGSGEWHSDSEIKIDKLGYAIRNGKKTKDFWDGIIRADKQSLRLKIRNICGDETVWRISIK